MELLVRFSQLNSSFQLKINLRNRLIAMLGFTSNTIGLRLARLPSPFSCMPQALSSLPERERDFEKFLPPSPVLGEGDEG
jgi:hypothetical protein